MIDWYKSETFWIGLAVTLIPILEEVMGLQTLEKYPYVVSIIGILIIILRKGTTKEIRFPFQKSPKKGRYL